MTLTINECVEKAERHMYYAEQYAQTYSDATKSIRESLLAQNLLLMAQQLRAEKSQ